MNTPLSNEKRVCKVLTELCGIETISMEQNLTKDLGLDSLRMVELIIGIEDEFNITFQQSDLNFYKLKNVGELVNLVEMYLSTRRKIMLWAQIKSRMLQHPNQIIEDSTQTITYKEAIQKVEELAKTLERKRYAIFCDSELNSGIAILSCFAAGATAIPLSSRYGELHCARITKLTSPHYTLSDEGGELHAKECAEFDHTAPDADCTLIMCTSGTTGTPKGAMITEENITANLNDIDRYFDIRCSDTILIARPLYHCAVLTGEFLIALIKN